QLAAGLASLDVQLPERGRLYRFTTPRGEVEITARAVPLTVISRLWALVAILVTVIVIWLMGHESSRRFWIWLSGTKTLAVGLILLGLASLIGGIFPVAGLMMVLAGIGLLLWSRWVDRHAAAASVA